MTEEHWTSSESQINGIPELRWPLGYLPTLLSVLLALYCLNTLHPLFLLLTAGLVVPGIWQYWKWVSGDIRSLGDDLISTILHIFRFSWISELAELKNGLFALLCVGVVSATYKIGTVIFFS